MTSASKMNAPDLQTKSLTFISRHGPYGSDNAQICLDVVLASSVFDQDVSYLFMGDGVYQLLGNQHPDTIDSKNLLAALQALEIYGVDKVFVDRLSLQKRQLSPDELAIAVTVLSADEVKTLVHETDQVFVL